MIALEDRHLAELASLLKEKVGLHVRPDSYHALRMAIRARIEERGEAAQGTIDAYLARLREDASGDELRALLPLVTVGKTNFFRDSRQFAALEALVPDLLQRRRKGGAPIAIWSAGCATGEEPYSIAMTAAEHGVLAEEIDLAATDLNPQAVAASSEGRYTARRVQEMEPGRIERFFQPDGSGYKVRPELRRMVGRIQPQNLNAPVYPRPQTGSWDIIFCRNVIIYFDTATARQVLSRFHAVLAPGGFLFLGYSESLFRLFDGFQLTEIAGAFVYRKPAKPLTPAVPRAPEPAPFYTPSAPVQHLSAPRAKPAAGPAPQPERSPQEILDASVTLVETGKFEAAVEQLERLVAQGGEDLAARLTLANLYGVLRQPERARESYQAALALEPLSAEAHLFFGIHLLGVGELDGAANELGRALYLDPDLALGHYYLGRCRERQRDPARARICYRNAVDAYRREPKGRRQSFLAYYPDVPEDGAAIARAAEYALAAL
jgi:chemotaxis protein methyltransferase CheR